MPRHHHHVYVVLLSRDVLHESRFVKCNPDYDPVKPCVYVGMTGLNPDDRFDKHKAGIRSNRFVKMYGQRLLPEGWVDYARTATWQQEDCLDDPYGAGWWLDLAGPGSFSANGYDGQFIILCPDRDLIIVRNGATPAEAMPALKAWLADLAGLFA